IDNVQDIRNWYRTAISSDFFVRATMPDLETYSSATIPDDVGQQLREIPGVTGIDAVRFLRGEAAGVSVMLMAREFADVSFVQFANLPISPEEMLERFERDEVVIGTVLAQRTGLRAGDAIPTKTAQGDVPLKIGAVVEEYQAGGLMIHM